MRYNKFKYLSFVISIVFMSMPSNKNNYKITIPIKLNKLNNSCSVRFSLSCQ